ncbi:MAG: tyrosine--tRNA ligase [Alphaproteobacteria bacterium]|nr:tyrosine--tRNA ligase [Alphaproteobacteria bacterium]
MQNFFEYLKERGLVYQMTHEKEIIDLLNGDKPFTFYLGIDPTADSLHIGHFFALRMFSLLQKQGHHGILLIGGATALVGDPTGKSDMRKMLSKDQVQHNVDEVIRLAKQFIRTDGENPARIVSNAEWMDKFSYVDFLRTACVHMNVNKMLASEAYSSRLENGGLTFLEMGYMPIQAYDFVHLNRTYGCAVQIGGSDQWGNIVAGVELSRKMNLAEGKTTAECPDTFAITSPLLMTKEGKKMGKTESGTLWVARDKTTPYHFYQYFYNTDDADTEMLLKVFTDIPTAEIVSMCQNDIREAKKRMAYEVTKLVHGAEEADKAVAASASLFSNGAASVDVPTKQVEKESVKDVSILDFIVATGFLASKGEARRLIEQQGLSLDGEKVTDGMAKIPADKTEFLLQKGKKNFLKIVLK